MITIYILCTVISDMKKTTVDEYCLLVFKLRILMIKYRKINKTCNDKVNCN